MPPDPDATFYRELAQTVAALVVAIEESDAPRGTAALKAMLNLIVAHRDARPRDEALRRAIERV